MTTIIVTVYSISLDRRVTRHGVNVLGRKFSRKMSGGKCLWGNNVLGKKSVAKFRLGSCLGNCPDLIVHVDYWTSGETVVIIH